MKFLRVPRWVRRMVVVLVLSGPAFVGFRWGTGNVGTVEPGQIYRSAQLSAGGLTRVIERHQIKTVLNLRGPNPETDWYPAERAATLEAGATQIDIPLASDHWLSRDQARTIVDVLETCERPVLIHCQFGSERTGLVSSLAALLQPDGDLSKARAQFSPWYLYVPSKDGLVMRGHLDRYESWLQSEGANHTPEQFRSWLLQTYRPGRPSREEWPYDPYPLRVVTKPLAVNR